MGTHYYATDRDRTLHVFHSQNGRDRWLSDQPFERRARPVKRREANTVIDRTRITRMTHSGHPEHLALHQPPE